MIPFIPLLLVAILLVKHGSPSRKPVPVQTFVGASAPSYYPPPAPSTGAVVVDPEGVFKHHFKRKLLLLAKNKKPISRLLCNQAIEEATRNRDYPFLFKLLDKLKQPNKARPALEKQNDSDSEDSKEDDNQEIDQEEPLDVTLPPGSSSDDSTINQNADMNSPIDIADDDGWQQFVDSLRTKTPGYKTNKYIGQYEQNIKRLEQLKLKPPTSDKEEYESLVADIQAHVKDSAGLINKWAGETLEINGEPYAIGASGILGLLKSAGAEGAKSWLENPADRLTYPNTTEAFVRTNGYF